MGGGFAQQTTGGGSGGGISGSLDAVVAVLNQILRELMLFIEPAQNNIAIEVINIALSGVAQNLYTQKKAVKNAIIQNLSTVDDLTVIGVPQARGTVATVTAYQGIVLNRATVAARGGGTLPLTNVDLAALTVRIADTGNIVAVKYET